jgi:hypothetical protein
LEVEAGRLVYQVDKRMWVGVQERVEIRLGRLEAHGIMEGFIGRGVVDTESLPIVETMSVTLECESGTFEIDNRTEKEQLVKPDIVRGTELFKDDYGRWLWLDEASAEQLRMLAIGVR